VRTSKRGREEERERERKRRYRIRKGKADSGFSTHEKKKNVSVILGSDNQVGGKKLLASGGKKTKRRYFGGEKGDYLGKWKEKALSTRLTSFGRKDSDRSKAARKKPPNAYL